jgi:hypothetical protein
VYVKLFFSVGKKCILLDACSIRIVYKGVSTAKELDVVELAATAVTARDTRAMLTTAHTVSLFFILSPPFVSLFNWQQLQLCSVLNFYTNINIHNCCR